MPTFWVVWIIQDSLYHCTQGTYYFIFITSAYKRYERAVSLIHRRSTWCCAPVNDSFAGGECRFSVSSSGEGVFAGAERCSSGPPPTNIASPEVAPHFISDDKGIHRIAVQEIALVEKSFRRIEMMQRHERKHAFFFAFRKDFMVEVHTLLICSSGPTKNKIFRWSKQLPIPYPCSLMIVCVTLRICGNRIQTIKKQLIALKNIFLFELPLLCWIFVYFCSF